MVSFNLIINADYYLYEYCKFFFDTYKVTANFLFGLKNKDENNTRSVSKICRVLNKTN